MFKFCFNFIILFLFLFFYSISPVFCEESLNALSSEISYKIYLTKKGDTLAGIAGLPDLYGDELKWPFIYALNQSELNFLRAEDVFVGDKVIPAGINLAILLPGEAKKYPSYASLCEKFTWVVNVTSDINKDEIGRMALNLMDSVYFVYLTTFDHENRSYIRLRVGFYSSREKAELIADRLKDKLDLPGIWVVRAGPKEVSEFAGFFGILGIKRKAYE